ncbi:alpha-hydroxy-acid oxidizing protein [Calorimonas adulescens]|uniref:L-lactate oxidase n=1 Tax=Calorimonas adulescens TaxID=2606906 RepID=A0A5D8QDA2_9THEO|nr:alpha-hydroxy-acid oxidizing protein [Calorimonas adulescens]TZE81328.1 alpha-hydroxy-acid oxidizing protein [Calorimonas adulescens]
MNYDELRKNARINMNNVCRGCKRCDGIACAGEVPGIGGVGSGEGFIENVRALSRVKLELKTLHNVKKPDISSEIFGENVSFPVLPAPMAGMKSNFGGYFTEYEFASILANACKELRLMYTSADGPDPNMFNAGIEAIKNTGVPSIVFIKPRGVKEVIEKIKVAEEAGAKAVGMDVDGAGLILMVRSGQEVGPKNTDELKEIISSTSLPVVLKGIMTVEEAKIAYESGAKGIVVSNHGGRVLEAAMATCDVLPEIAEKFKRKMAIFVDGGVRSGVDVLKMLALGADAVIVGRPVAIAAHGGRIDGVKWLLKNYADELYQAMILTGTPDVHINSEIECFGNNILIKIKERGTWRV